MGGLVISNLVKHVRGTVREGDRLPGDTNGVDSEAGVRKGS